MTIETTSQEELLTSFKERYQNLVSENQTLTQKIKENEVQALKLLGAIETLEYLTKDDEAEVDSVEE
jgi:hypothetical protein